MVEIVIKIIIGIVVLKNFFDIDAWNESCDRLNCPDKLRSLVISIGASVIFIAFFMWLYLCSKYELSEYIHLLEIDRHLTNMTYQLWR